MNILKRVGAILFCIGLIFSQIVYSSEKSKEITIKNGNYIVLGSYMGTPIIWRCVGSDENGMLLISRDILCFKAYAAESGRWDESFLRKWLNSEDKTVDWEGSAPDRENTDGNAYDSEAGFLSGFSAEELEIIKTVEQKSAINVNYLADAMVGSEVHIYNSNGVFARSIQNYDKAFGVLTEDKVFCLNMEQMEIVAANYPSEFISEPRDEAVEQSGNIKNEENRSNNYYWLRDGIGNVEFPEAVRCVYPSGRVFFADANDSSIGVRPGIYVDEKIKVISGNGYEASPYVVSEGSGSAAVEKGSANKNRERFTDYGLYASVTEGDYLVMGNIYGNDIVWRCVDINENGPLMLSEKILNFRAYDASGEHGGGQRNTYGSNSWINSNLRYWLNSNEPEGEKEWPCGNKPNSDNTGRANGYSNEKGFLTSFSPEELQHIKTVSIRTLIHPMDVDENTFGTEGMEMQRNINNLANYETAYSVQSDDRIFLLSINEAKAVKADFGDIILAMPTPEAVNMNEASIDDLSADRTAAWWLRDADARDNYSGCVRTITQDGWVDSDYAMNPGLGVRPAFYLDMESVVFLSGDGSLENPYRVQSHEYGEWTVTVEPGCTEPGVRSRICSICGYADEEKIPATGHDFEEKISYSDGLFHTITEKTCKNCGEVYKERKLNIMPAVAGGILIAAVLAWIFILKRKR